MAKFYNPGNKIKFFFDIDSNRLTKFIILPHSSHLCEGHYSHNDIIAFQQQI